MKKVAVTGGTGCLGRALVQRLVEMGVAVNLLTRSPRGTAVDSRVTLYEGDLESCDVLKELTADCDVIFHLAGKVHTVPRSVVEEQAFFKTNVDGTRNLLDAAETNNVRRLVFFSTVGVYGRDADFHGDELSPCHPQTAYGRSKLKAEELVLSSCARGGPDGVVLRFPVVYGPGDRGNMARLINAVRYRLFILFGGGEALRSMISSRNAADAAIKAAMEPEAGNQVFCVTDGRDYSMNEIIDSIVRALNRDGRPMHVPLGLAELAGRCGDLIERLAHISFPVNSERVRKLSGSLTFSNIRAERVLGYEAPDSLEEGIRREVEWLGSNKWQSQ